MATEPDLVTFLKTRNIPESNINQLKDDKIDVNVINIMSDEELGRYIVRYGDRLAVRAFCRQRSVASEQTREEGTVKSALMQRVRDRLREKEKTASIRDTAGPGVGNKHAAKETRRVEMGWLHLDKGDYHQVRTRQGGGTRHLSVQKTVTMGELLETGKTLFFPNGLSARGPVEDFSFDIRVFSHKSVPLEMTVNQLYQQTNLRMVRIYTCSQRKAEVSPSDDSIILSDTSSDFEPTEDRPIKARKKLRKSERNKTRGCHHSKTRTDQQMDQPERSYNSDSSPSCSMEGKNKTTVEPSQPSRPASTELENTEALHSVSSDDVGTPTCQSRGLQEYEDDCLIFESNPDAEPFYNGPDSSVSHAIQASLDNSEVQFGPASVSDGDQDSTLPWEPLELSSLQHSSLNDGPASSTDNFAASPDQSEKEVRQVTLRRINIVHDVLKVFMEPNVLNVDLKMELTNEKAMDNDGVSREVYSAFWEHFLDQCEGEDERVPRLEPDYSEKEWQAVGRVWLKGYLDHNIIPIRLSPAFILACCQGLSSVDEELLMMSFSRFLSVTDRESVEKALQGHMDENIKEDLLNLFSRTGSRSLPSKDNLGAAILALARKVLLQEPKFIIDCFHSVIHNAVPLLTTKDRIIELYESKRPTNRKVAQMIKPSNEILNSQEQSALNYLICYVRSLDQRKLEVFLRFCTGSTVLCKDTIEVTFNKLYGLGRRPVAHTCAAVLELPCTYSSYPELRKELDSILSGDCFTMDIV